MKNIANLIILGVFTVGVSLGFVEKPENSGVLENLPVIIEPNIVEDTIYGEDEVEYLHGVFLATVYNLDFPSALNMSESSLKAEIDEILDNIQKAEITDVFFQVRPCADAFYYSEYFPTSVYLTGNQDIKPSFDVLEYYVQGCHDRGLKLHAWINPYRITKLESDVLSNTHIAVTNPELVVTHSDGSLYFDPGLPEARQLILDGIEEIIANYDVDGIHFDDYFYPSTTFADDASYAKYSNGMSLDDWRRDNVTTLVSDANDLIKSYSSDILFGISPIGIWGNYPEFPEGSLTNGNSSYKVQYADTKKWVEMGILDYIAPQIYWKIGYEIAEYLTLVDWWDAVCDGTDVSLFICHANYREVSGAFEDGEIERQIEYNQTKDNVSGSIYFRYEHILEN
ncbi:MAG: family 10 glycosylhydrolase [Clostridia bacterium]